MIRAYLLSFLAGLVSALMFATYSANLSLAMLVIPFAPLPLFFAGFSMGLRSVLLAGGAASVLTGLVGGSFYFALVYAVTVLAPVALMVRQALLNRAQPDGTTEWYPAGRLFTVLVVFMCGLFLLLCAFLAGVGGGVTGFLAALIEEAYRAALPASGTAPPEGLPAGVAKLTAERALMWSPGLSVLFTALSMVAAQSVLARFGKAIRPSFDLIRLELPLWLTYGLVLAAVLGFVAPGEIKLVGRAVAVAVGVPFLFLGLSVIHAFARKWPAGAIVLILTYGLLLFVPLAGAAVAALGLLERWLRLRARAGGSGRTKE